MPIINYNLLSQALKNRHRGYLNFIDDPQPQLGKNQRTSVTEASMTNKRYQSLTTLGQITPQKKVRRNVVSDQHTVDASFLPLVKEVKIRQSL